jgi:hypothetical protein
VLLWWYKTLVARPNLLADRRAPGHLNHRSLWLLPALAAMLAPEAVDKEEEEEEEEEECQV